MAFLPSINRGESLARRALTEDEDRFCKDPPPLPQQFETQSFGADGKFSQVDLQAIRQRDWDPLHGPAAQRAQARQLLREKEARYEQRFEKRGLTSPEHQWEEKKIEDEFESIKRRASQLEKYEKMRYERARQGIQIGPQSHARRQEDASDIIEEQNLHKTAREALELQGLQLKEHTKRRARQMETGGLDDEKLQAQMRGSVLEPFILDQRKTMMNTILEIEEAERRKEIKRKRKEAKRRRARADTSQSLPELTPPLKKDKKKSKRTRKEPSLVDHLGEKINERNNKRKAEMAVKKTLASAEEKVKLLKALTMSKAEMEEKKDFILTEAAEIGNVRFMKIALDAGADIEIDLNGRPLFLHLFGELVQMEAGVCAPTYYDKVTGQLQGGFHMQRNFEACMELALKHGADVNCFEDREDTELLSSIHVAAQHGVVARIEWLLQKKVDIDMRTKGLGRTALMVASEHRQMFAVITLIRDGANLFATDESGMTALHWAGWKGAKDISKVLLACGLDKDILDKEGNSAADLAWQGRKKNTSNLIKKYRPSRIDITNLLDYWENLYNNKYAADELSVAETGSIASEHTEYSRFSLSFEGMKIKDQEMRRGSVHSEITVEDSLSGFSSRRVSLETTTNPPSPASDKPKSINQNILNVRFFTKYSEGLVEQKKNAQRMFMSKLKKGLNISIPDRNIDDSSSVVSDITMDGNENESVSPHSQNEIMQSNKIPLKVKIKVKQPVSFLKQVK